MEDVKDTFEIIVDLKDQPTTFVSKKMNPTRRALVFEKIMSPLVSNSPDSKKADYNVGEDIKATVQLFNVLPDIMWEFVRDEDKQKIGTKISFADGLDDDNSIQFIQWCAMKLKKMQDFLGSSGETVKK